MLLFVKEVQDWNTKVLLWIPAFFQSMTNKGLLSSRKKIQTNSHSNNVYYFLGLISHMIIDLSIITNMHT